MENLGFAGLSSPGGVHMDVRWSKSATAKFQRIRSQTFRRLSNWQFFWERGIQQIISEDIAENIRFRHDPNGIPWSGLSVAYQRVVGRPYMLINEHSDIWSAYVNKPDIRKTKTSLSYSPGVTNMLFGGGKRYDLALRRGWMSDKGGNAPPREWFGLSEEAKGRIDDKMAEWVVEETMKIEGRAYKSRAIG